MRKQTNKQTKPHQKKKKTQTNKKPSTSTQECSPYLSGQLKDSAAHLPLEMAGHFFTKELLILILPSPSELLNCEQRSHSVTLYNPMGGIFNKTNPSL